MQDTLPIAGARWRQGPMVLAALVASLSAFSTATAQVENLANVSTDAGEIIPGVVGSAAVARPGVPPLDPGPELDDPFSEPGSRFGVEIGGAWVSEYYFRGIIQEDDGFIFQPYLDLSVALVRNDTLDLDLLAGTWSSLHGDTDTAGDGDPMPNYYELDLYGGLSMVFGNIGVDVLYIAYTSPSGAFDTVQEIDFSVAYDDADDPLLGALTLNPYVAFGFELENAADGGDEGGYVELGVAPSYTFAPDEALDGLTISLPVTVGLSLYDYYELDGDDETFGFVDIGLDFGFGVPIDASFGELSVNAGVHLLILGDHTETYNSGDDLEVVFSAGASLAF